MPNKPEPSWGEAIDDLLEELIDIDWEKDTEARQSYLDAAKQLFTDAVEKLVKENMPEPDTTLDGNEAQVFIIATDTYQTNLINLIRRDVK